MNWTTSKLKTYGLPKTLYEEMKMQDGLGENICRTRI